MKVFLSGPMTGMPQDNYPAFRSAARELRTMGYEVISPAEFEGKRELSARELESFTWENYMRRSISMLVEADAVVALPGWRNSKGSTLEIEIAHALGMPVRFLDLMITPADVPVQALGEI